MWGTLAVLLALVIAEVRIEVLLSYYCNDLFSALQMAFQGAGGHDAAQRDSGVHGFWVAIGIFVILAVVNIARLVFDTYLTQRFIIRWRVWLTHRLTGDWLADGRTTAPASRAPSSTIPISASSRTSTSSPPAWAPAPTFRRTTPEHAAVRRGRCGRLGGVLHRDPVATVGSAESLRVRIPKALFWIVLGYVVIGSVIAFWIGRPLIRLSFLNEKTNAAFRYAMVRLRDSAEAVAFYGGERAEREQLDTRFGAIIANYRRYVRRTIGLIGWNYSVTQAIVPLPFLVQTPRLFAGAIKLGDVMQSASAFG